MRKKAELKGFDPGPLQVLQERKSLGEHVFDNLKQAIIRGHITAGEWLVESHIAQMLGISRTPVREAIHKLERERLIERQPRLGAARHGPGDGQGGRREAPGEEPDGSSARFDLLVRLAGLLAGFLPPDLKLSIVWSGVLENIVLGFSVVAMFTFVPLYRLREMRPVMILRQESIRSAKRWPIYASVVSRAALGCPSTALA